MSQIIGEFDDVFRDDYVSNQITVTTTPVELKVGASKLSGREYIFIVNLGNQTIWLNSSNAVSSTNGMPLEKGEKIGIPLGEPLTMWAVTATATAIISLSEFA